MIALADPDCLLLCDDVRTALAALPPGSVDCVVTSPPYYGLRDYGVDGQIGLEPSPDAFLAALVEVFRLVRRALAAHGTCWVNMGDSYTTGGKAAGSVDNAAHDGGVFQGEGHPQPFRSARYTGQRRSIPSDLPAKNLLGMPWELALALRNDGWYLRRDVIWAKPNPMPEPATDRCTTAHEYVFHLTKSPRYFYDSAACPEALSQVWRDDAAARKSKPPVTVNPDSPYRSQPNVSRSGGVGYDNGRDDRNMRSVWSIPTEPNPDAHFATFPRELVRRCLLLGCPADVCRRCGVPRSRIVAKHYKSSSDLRDPGSETTLTAGRGRNTLRMGDGVTVETLGFTDCGCEAGWRPGTVLDPFVGSGTTCKVARDHGRRSIGIDLNPEYLALARRRLQQLSLLADAVAHADPAGMRTHLGTDPDPLAVVLDAPGGTQ